MRRCAAAIVLLLRSSSTGVSAATEDGNNGEQLRGLQGPPPQRPCYAPDPTDPDYISKKLPPDWKPKNCEGTPIPNPGLNPDQNGAGGGGLPPESNKENQLALSSVPAGCNVEAPNWIGDGYCDKGGNYNTPDCHFDGGDCCEETCEDNKYSCGAVGYDCKCGFRDGTNVKRTEFKFTSDADEGGALLADPLHNDIYAREGWLDQTSAPYLRKEGNPQQATNNTYTRREKCTLDVEIKCFIKSNDPEEQDIPAADCIEADIHEVCFEDAEVVVEICASADDMEEGTRVNLTDSSVGYRGEKEEAPVADFTHDGKIVVGGHDSKSCFTYTKHMNQCTSPLNSVVKLTGESDGYPAGCRGSAEYATSEDIKKMQASKRRKPYKQAKQAAKPPQDHSIAVQSELEVFQCDVNWIALFTGGLAVAASAGFALAAAPTGGLTLAIAVPALTAGVAAIASSTSCADYSHPERQFENTEGAIRQIIKLANAGQTSVVYAEFLQQVQLFQDENGVMDLDMVSESKLDSLNTMGFTVKTHALGSDILSLQVYALTTQVQVMTRFAQLRRQTSGSYDCGLIARDIWLLLDQTVKKIEEVYKRFAVTERDNNLYAECWCDGCGFGNFKTEARWLAQSKFLKPQIRVYHGDCGGWDSATCHSRWRCDQPIRQYRAQWEQMVDVWWWGRGKPSDTNYVMGVAKPYHELLKLRDVYIGSANLARVCGAPRSESATSDLATTVHCGCGKRASSCQECPRMGDGTWRPDLCGGDCQYVWMTQWRNPGKPDKCISREDLGSNTDFCGDGSEGDGICPNDTEQCCSRWGYCGSTYDHCWRPLTSPTIEQK